MEGTHRKVGSRPFMPDPTLTCLCSALLGHIAKLGSITHPKQRRATILDKGRTPSDSGTGPRGREERVGGSATGRNGSAKRPVEH